MVVLYHSFRVEHNLKPFYPRKNMAEDIQKKALRCYMFITFSIEWHIFTFLNHQLIQLLPNLIKPAIQVKRFHADLVAAHLIGVVGDNLFVCFGVEQHSRNGYLPVLQFFLLVLDVGKNLIQVCLVDSCLIKPLLCGMGVIFCVDNQNVIVFFEHNI